MNLLLVTCCAVLVVPVTSQMFHQSNSGFPTGLGSSFSLPTSDTKIAPPSAFIPEQSFPLTEGEMKGPFRAFQPPPQPPPQPQQLRRQPPLQQFATTTSNNNNGMAENGEQADHTYGPGDMDGDYPAHLAAKKAKQAAATTGHQSQQGQLSGLQSQQGPFTTAQFSQPQFAVANQQPAPKPKEHSYEPGTEGGDYPSHMAAQKQKQQRQQLLDAQRQQNPFSSPQFSQPQFAVSNQQPAPKPEKHSYAPGTEGGDYPSHMAAQKQKQQQQQILDAQRQQHTFSTPQFSQSQFAAHNQQPAPKPEKHSYAPGTEGGDYPSHLAAQKQKQQQQQHPFNQFSQPQFVNSNNKPVQQPAPKPEKHSYAPGTEGGDYPSHKAALEQKKQQQQILDAQRQQKPYSSPQFSQPQFAARSQQPAPKPKEHSYAPGTEGGDYPSHLAAQKQKQQQQQHPFNTAQFSQPRFVITNNKPVQQPAPKPKEHSYAPGTEGGDYPSHLAALKQKQQQQQQPFNTAQFSQPQFVISSNKPVQRQSPPKPEEHSYAPGTEGGDYPSHLAAQKQKQQQQQILSAQFGTQIPAHLLRPQLRNDAQQNPDQAEPGYGDGTPGGDYPAKKAAKQQHLVQHPPQSHQFKGQAPGHVLPTQSRSNVHPPSQAQPMTYGADSTGQDYPTRQAALAQEGASAGYGHQAFKARTSPNTAVFPPRQLSPVKTFRINQVFPPSSAQHQLFSPVRDPAHTPRPFSYGDPQPQGSSHNIPAAQFTQALVSRSSPTQAHPALPLSLSPSSAQCVRYQDLAASYKLSDADDDYPMDAIMSELRANPAMGPMVGFESIPEEKETSPFASFGESFGLPDTFSSLGFPKKTANKMAVTNVKVFPDNFDEHTLKESMPLPVSVCPAHSYTLRAVTVDKTRCSVVNADYQDITVVQCTTGGSECSQCQQRSGKVSACAETYSWQTVTVYCPHWQPAHRIKTLRLYLPQSCSCNQYLC